jgi:16S rRNA (adenine1518-N6/adenine1519-N6)-dimethyltransferase
VPQPTLTGKKSLGQNFLVDESVIDRIIDAFDPQSHDVVLEIGPGHGALTGRVIDSVSKMFALEFDRDLSRRLAARFEDRSNFTVIEDDALSVDFTALRLETDRPIRLIANLPYNISTVILQRLFDVTDVFSDCVLMFQREVVERITAEPGTKDRGYLTVMTEAYFNVEYLFDVPPSAFQPQPKVWSSVARLTPKPSVPDDPDSFRQLAGISFSQKRKTIGNNLKHAFPNYGRALSSAGIDSSRRAETLTLDEWLRLSDAITPAD